MSPAAMVAVPIVSEGPQGKDACQQRCGVRARHATGAERAQLILDQVKQ
jgi:hypothetical protein